MLFRSIATAALVAAMVLGGLYFMLRTPSGVTASASSTFHDMDVFRAENVLDGDSSTEWFLQDRASGWVEARIVPAVDISSVTVTNSDNPPHFDRAAREFRVELYSHGELIASEEGEFEALDHDPAPRTIAIEGAAVDRVRAVVLSHHALGGGLADVTWE